MTAQVELQNTIQDFFTPSLTELTAWVSLALDTNSLSNAVTIRVVSINEMAELNQTFRQKSGPTNILSFTYTPIPGDDETAEYLGDLAICADIITQEAQEQGKTLLAHWAHLIIHGTLHLQGYDHLTEAEAEIMEQREIELLQQLGFANPYEDSTLT